VEKLQNGILFSSGSTDRFTIIRTGVGPAFTGDAVLYLKDTKCKNIILFGSCGLTKKTDRLDIGSLVSPKACYNWESFSDVLTKSHKESIVRYPDKIFFDNLISIDSTNISPVTCVSMGSLKLQEQFQDYFLKEKIDILDMECSAFFSASKKTKKRSIALFYCSDILKEYPFYHPLSCNYPEKISSAIKKGIQILMSCL
jgi:purine-nucleoside phosphorylase